MVFFNAAKKSKNLYESFVHARDREERGLTNPGSSVEGGSGSKAEKRHGNTIYVFGYQITEDILKNTFANCGKIVNISMEVEKVLLTTFTAVCITELVPIHNMLENVCFRTVVS